MSYCCEVKDWLALHMLPMPPVWEYGLSAGDLDSDWITGGRERAIVGPKLSGFYGDLDCQGTAVFCSLC
jgi:hypothetical protein